MMSQIGLVCLPAATYACWGRVIASMNAHASTMNAATASATKKYASGVYALLPMIETTALRYLVLGLVRVLCGACGLTDNRDHFGGGRRLLRLPAEGLVDLDQHLLLPLGELRVGEQRG